MKLSAYTVKHLAKMVTGDTEGWPYRKGPELVNLFNQYGFRDVYGQGFPSRSAFVEEKLKAMSGKEIVKDLIKDLLAPRAWLEPTKPLKAIDECATQLNDLVKHDNLEVIKDGLYYKVRDLSGSLIKPELPFQKASAVTEIFIEEQINKCREKINSADYDGAASQGANEGSVFAVTLPLAQQQTEQDLEDDNKNKDLTMQKILLIDDNVDFTVTMAGALGYFGNEVFVCHDGIKGIELYKQERPNVVICDIGLPGMTGYDVARSIFAAANEANSSPRLIALSGYGQENDKLLAHEAGFAKHFTKPVDLEALLDALQ